MFEEVNLTKRVYRTEDFKNIVDTRFTTFTPLLDGAEVPPTIEDSIQSFFNEYERLYFQIPALGELSHEYLVKKSSEIVGFDVETEEITKLLQEIESLRSQLIEAYTQLSKE